MALIGSLRNSMQVVCLFLVICSGFVPGHGEVLVELLGVQVAHAQANPFEVSLEGLKKINPENVVQFRVVAFEALPGAETHATVQMRTRGGFKIYGKGLEFQYEDALAVAPVGLGITANPPAKRIMDPFYNEERDVHLDNSEFTIVWPKGTGVGTDGRIVVRFEACSLTNCLLPSRFALEPLVGSVGKVLGRAANQGNSLLSGLSNAEAPTSTSSQSSSQAKSNAELGFGEAPLPTVEKITTEKKAVENSTAENSTTDKGTAPLQAPKAASLGLTDMASLWVRDGLMARSFLLFPALFFAGLLMNLTPCVYPMIPITLNVLSQFGASAAGASEEEKRRKRRVLPFVYVGGMVLSYSAMGVVAGMGGTLFGSLLQSTGVNLALSVLMFLLGLSMLGFFNMTALQNFGTRIPVATRYPTAGVLTMGAVSGLVSAPCTGPVLSTILLLIGQSKDPVYGFVLMVFFALGFGAPYVGLGLFTQKLARVPKAGNLLLLVKTLFAALMFAMSLYYLKSIIGRSESLGVLFERPGLLGVTCAVLLFAVFFLLGKANASLMKVARVGSVLSLTVLALWMTLYVTSGFVVGRVASASDSSKAVSVAAASAVKWEHNWEMAKKRAQIENKPVVVDAWAEWCAACLKMDEDLWARTDVAKLLNERFVAVKLDFTKTTPFMEEFVTRWDLSGLPAVGFFPRGANLADPPSVLFREAIDLTRFQEAVAKVDR